MKVESSKVEKMKLSEMDGLDPVTVFLEDFEKGQGEITIKCYGKSWTSYWGAMGSSIKEFFISSPTDYLLKNLSNVDSTVKDFGGLSEFYEKRVLKDRRSRDIEADTAKRLYEAAQNLCVSNMSEIESAASHDSDISELIGDEWWYDIPEAPNHEYQYIERIIKAVKEGLGHEV